MRASALSAIALLALVGLSMSAPVSVVACQCGELEEGDVVFTGTVVDSPNELTLLHDIRPADPGVYTFDVESVTRGDARDGRVSSGGATCEGSYEVGAKYRVHARHGPEDENGVSLAMGPCMVAPELMAPPAPLTALPYWALSLRGVLVLSVAGLALLLGIGAYLYWRPRSSAVVRVDSG